MEVFGLNEVAEAIAVPKSRVKNWTIGRPFRIKPTIRASRGKGTPNLYSREDIYVLALVNHLSQNGFSPSVIWEILEFLRGKRRDRPIKRPAGLMINRIGKQIAYAIDTYNEDHERAFSEIMSTPPQFDIYYLIDLRALWKRIDEVIRKFSQRNS